MFFSGRSILRGENTFFSLWYLSRLKEKIDCDCFVHVIPNIFQVAVEIENRQKLFGFSISP